MSYTEMKRASMTLGLTEYQIFVAAHRAHFPGSTETEAEREFHRFLNTAEMPQYVADFCKATRRPMPEREALFNGA